jgi:hypothetical protein
MAWFYQIRDANDNVISTGAGFSTQEAALNAGHIEAQGLAKTGNLPGSGFRTVTAGQGSEDPSQQQSSK